MLLGFTSEGDARVHSKLKFSITAKRRIYTRHYSSTIKLECRIDVEQNPLIDMNMKLMRRQLINDQSYSRTN